MKQSDTDFAEWLAFHKPQLDRIAFPESLHRQLFQKASFEDFDIGSIAKIIIDETKDRTELICTKEVKKESQVYLFDHAWTFRFQDGVNTLK